MNLDNAVWLLTGLAAVVVLLTRSRLSNEQRQAGHAKVPQEIVNAHTLMGIVTPGTRLLYLTSPGSTLGTLTLAAL